MKKLKIIYSLCLILSMSCTKPNFYQAAYSAKEAKYLQKANPKSKSQKAFYLNGTVSNGEAKLYNELNNSFELSGHYSESKEYSVFAIGAFAYMGDFHARNLDTDEREVKTYRGLGFRFDGGVNIPLGGINWRIINFQGAVSYEDGDFFNYRKELSERPNIVNLAENRVTFSPFMYTDLAIVLNPDYQFNFYYGVGSIINSSRISFYKTGLGIEIKNFVLGYESSATALAISNSNSITFSYKF